LHRLPIVSFALVVFGLTTTGSAQVADPLPAPVEKRGLTVEVRDIVRLPETRRLRPVEQDVTPTGWARVSFMRDLPDGRRFANDSRGFLYLVDGDTTSLYADLAAVFPHAHYARLESGFIGFDFHPEFARNGLWYSVHLERAEGNPGKPDFIPPGYGPSDVTYHNVITEWHATDPAANTFSGTTRAIHSATWVSIPRRDRAHRTMGSSIRAAATSASATAADRTRAIRRKRSASIPS